MLLLSFLVAHSINAQCPSPVYLTTTSLSETQGDICLYSFDVYLNMPIAGYELNGLRLWYEIIATDCTGEDVKNEIIYDIPKMENSLHPQLVGKLTFNEEANKKLSTATSSSVAYSLLSGDNLLYKIYFYAPSCTDISVNYDPVMDQRYIFDGNLCDYTESGTINTFTSGGECFKGNIEALCCDGPAGPMGSVEVTLWDVTNSPFEVDDIDLTNSNGNYCLEMCALNDVTDPCGPQPCTTTHIARIEPRKDDQEYCGVDNDDYTWIYNYLTDNICLPCTKYAYFAADVDGDGDIDWSDAGLILDMINQTFTLDEYWRFIPKETYNYWGTGINSHGCKSPDFPLSYNPYVEFGLIPGTAGPYPDFYGIKLGDIDGSCHCEINNPPLQDGDSADKLLAYPNPIINEVMVNKPVNSSISIYDHMGKVVLTDHTKGGRISFGTGNLNSGFYYIESSDGQLIKVIKQ